MDISRVARRRGVHSTYIRARKPLGAKASSQVRNWVEGGGGGEFDHSTTPPRRVRYSFRGLDRQVWSWQREGRLSKGQEERFYREGK